MRVIETGTEVIHASHTGTYLYGGPDQSGRRLPRSNARRPGRTRRADRHHVDTDEDGIDRVYLRTRANVFPTVEHSSSTCYPPPEPNPDRRSP